jgi:hypothetical protein
MTRIPRRVDLTRSVERWYSESLARLLFGLRSLPTSVSYTANLIAPGTSG